MFTCKMSAVLPELSNANGLAALFGICAIFFGAILEDLEDAFCKDVKCESTIVLSYICEIIHSILANT